MIGLKKGILIAVISMVIFPFVPNVQAEEDQQQLRNLAKGLGYEWSEEPHPDFPDSGTQLTDGEYGTLDKSDSAWVGHRYKKTREIVFDLGEKKSIANIKAHFLQDYPASSILVPLTVSMYVSDDKENWGTLSHNATQLLWGNGPPREEFYIWDGSKDGVKGNPNVEMAYARYVKVTFSMHTSTWTFIDEIEIWGTDGKMEGAATVPPKQPAYLEPGEATAGIENLGLLYNGYYESGVGDWTKEAITSYISYVDPNGKPIDKLFDGVLYLGLLSPSGRSFETGTANLEDWQWYLDKTFAKEGDMQQLNEATIEVSEQLNQPDYKEKVVLMIPYPGAGLADFGDGDRKKAVDWWIDQVMQKWDEKNYSHLELAGLYWLQEQVDTSDSGPEILRYASDLVHKEGLKFFWIPHFLAYKSYLWDEVGFDAATFQPNYFFGDMAPERIEDAANIAKQYGMGVEIEFDNRMLTDPIFRQKYIEYLNGGIQYGYMQDTFKAYYTGGGPLKAVTSDDPHIRVLYDWLYQFTKGHYQKPSTSSKQIKNRIANFERDGEFLDQQAMHSLQIHLTALEHFEKQGASEKVVKHLEGFKLLLEQQWKNEQITWLTYNTLRADAEFLKEKWG
ncbi:DUF4855 domain-containing protein [Lederbergia ruris]|uniref:DUF4855 domain-containing protein n=1 Tax=Lederbergia ruris TaxID=217495 RepID=UPI0039A225D2